MDNGNSKALKIIDSALFVTVFIYLASLTNSIFVNQAGYFLSLILLLCRAFITRENVFKRNGLETALIIMIAAEIIATVFSINKGQSFHNLFKFLLLIPTLYLFSAAPFDFKRLKMFFFIYMGFALAGCIIYLILSYNYIIYNQFQIQQSGPSPFKYPITASELISFTVVFSLSFLLNEKTTRRNKTLLFAAFIISSLALLAIYKRTGWLGTGAGILFVLLYSKKWKIVIPFFIAAALLVFFEKNISELNIYKENGNTLIKDASVKTGGRAYDIASDSGKIYLSDYENGIVEVKEDNRLEKILDAPSAAAAFTKWTGKYYTAYLNDTRFVLYEKENDGGFKMLGQFFSPGFTNCYKQANGLLYVCDEDSGLTVFKNPADTKDSIRYGKITEVSKMFADSAFIAAYSVKKNELNVYGLEKGLPANIIYTYSQKEKFDLAGCVNEEIILSDKEGVSALIKKESGFEKILLNKDIKNIYLTENKKDTLYILSMEKKLYKTIPSDGKLNIIGVSTLDFLPGNMALSGNKIYLTRLRESRFASAFDKYNLSNLTRLALWSAGMKIFGEHPIAGVGNIDLAEQYKLYKKDYNKEIQGHMHNNFIHIMVTLGIIGLIAFLFLLYKIFSRLNSVYRETKGTPFISSYVIGTMGGVVAFIVAGLTEWNFGDHEIITMIWFSAGLCFGLLNSYKREKANQ